MFIGEMRGQHFVYQQPPLYTVLTGNWTSYLSPQPYVHGEKLSLKPTENLELGVSLRAQFAGAGVPFTTATFLRTFNNYSTSIYNNGNRQTGFQFSYRLPRLRNWLTLYSDSMAEDEPNPIAFPRRSAMNPGIYLSHFPAVPRLDLHIEGVYTDLPNLRQAGIYYADPRYVSGMTNYGVIMGSWVGRQGRGVQAWTNYYVAPRRTIRFGYRYGAISPSFIPNGGSMNDFYMSAEWRIAPTVAISGTAQYEKWRIPLLAAGGQTNFMSTVQVTWSPKNLLALESGK
jgi:hypothetical protein